MCLLVRIYVTKSGSEEQRPELTEIAPIEPALDIQNPLLAFFKQGIEIMWVESPYRTVVSSYSRCVFVWESTGSRPAETTSDRQFSACGLFVKETQWQISSQQQRYQCSWTLKGDFGPPPPPASWPVVSPSLLTFKQANNNNNNKNSIIFANVKILSIAETAVHDFGANRTATDVVMSPVTTQNLYSRNQ